MTKRELADETRKRADAPPLTAEELDMLMATFVARAYFGVSTPEEIPGRLEELAEQPSPILAAMGRKDEP